MMLKHEFGVSDAAIGIAIGCTGQMVGNCLGLPLFTAQELPRIRKASPGPETDRPAARRLLAERRAKFLVPPESETRAVQALRDAVAVAGEVFAMVKRRRVDQRALASVLKA
jgi:hypothetical protein